MSEIKIPGDEIDEARRNMQAVIDLFDSTSTAFLAIDAALGSEPTVTSAADDFKKRWDDGRTQLRDEGAKIIAALKKVLDTFDKTDQDLVSNLDTSGAPAADPSGSSRPVTTVNR